MRPKLDRWVLCGNTLVGYLYDWPWVPKGARVQTEAVVDLDVIAKEARCLDGEFKLGDPGTAEEHNQPLIGA